MAPLGGKEEENDNWPPPFLIRAAPFYGKLERKDSRAPLSHAASWPCAYLNCGSPLEGQIHFALSLSLSLSQVHVIWPHYKMCAKMESNYYKINWSGLCLRSCSSVITTYVVGTFPRIAAAFPQIMQGTNLVSSLSKSSVVP